MRPKKGRDSNINNAIVYDVEILSHIIYFVAISCSFCCSRGRQFIWQSDIDIDNSSRSEHKQMTAVCMISWFSDVQKCRNVWSKQIYQLIMYNALWLSPDKTFWFVLFASHICSLLLVYVHSGQHPKTISIFINKFWSTCTVDPEVDNVGFKNI